jgi:ribosome biogenesis GTPase
MQQRHDELVDIYSSIGYPCYAVSALDGTNMDQLMGELSDRISLFTGHSGVGKSALINRIDPDIEIKTGQLSDYWQKGQHTTTFAEMHRLRQGGFIIDTPGIREFGLLEFGKEELTHYFPELFALLEHCKYYNCTHVHEPGCAAREALEKGSVSEERYGNYLRMLEGDDMDLADWELE